MSVSLNLPDVPEVITFNTGFYRKGVVVMQRREIMCNYLKTWFVLDLLASFPYHWVINFDSLASEEADSSSVFRTPQLLRFLKIMRFIRILRLLRVLRLHRIFIRLEENIASETMNIIIKFIKLIILITFIAHWIACFFFAVGYSELPDPNSWLVVSGIDSAPVET